MSELDQSFAERLREETEFPNQEKNWKALSQRLQAVGASGATPGSSVLRYWQVAAAGLALVSAALFWKVYDLQQTNAALKQAAQIEQLESAARTAAALEQARSERTFSPTTTPSEETNFDFPGPSIPLADAPKRAARPLVTLPTHSSTDLPIAQKYTSQVPGLTETAASDRSAASAKSDLPFSIGSAALAAAGEATSPTPQLAELALLEQVALPALSGPERPVELPAAIPVTPPVIQPYHEKNSRFQAGIQAVAAKASPSEAGISWHKGAGMQAAFSPLKNFWLTAEFDGLSYTVKTMDYLPKRFFPADPPKPPDSHGGGPHPAKLVQVEGTQQQRLFSLGARYVLPVKCWIKPSVQVAHSWLSMRPTIYSFTFDDFDPGHPNQHDKEQIAKSVEGYTLNNVWRFGLGLQHETTNWVFRAGAEWMESSGASLPTADALVFRTGLSYKF